MDTQLKEGIMGKWLKYLPEQEMPIAVFYADDLHGSELAEKPKENPRGYTCMFAQLAKVHRGRSVALSKDNLGCWGAIENLFGGPYIEDATVKLLVEIEKFKKDREHVNALQTINPKAKPTGKYAIITVLTHGIMVRMGTQYFLKVSTVINPNIVVIAFWTVMALSYLIIIPFCNHYLPRVTGLFDKKNDRHDSN